MFPIIRIGPLSLQAPGLMLLLSLWIGISLAEKSAKAYKVSAEKLSTLILVALIVGILGARIAYIVRFPQAFTGNLRDIFSLNPGLFDITGGIAAAIIGAMIYGQKKEMGFWETLDALIPFFGMLAIGLATSNLFSGKGFGMETSLPWGIKLRGAIRHPSQIYEMLAALMTLNLLWPPKQNANPQTGISFLTFTALTAGYKVFLEAFRGDSTLIFGDIRSAQAITLVTLAFTLWLLDKRKTKRSTT